MKKITPKYGSTVKNLTLTFLPQFFLGVHIYVEGPTFHRGTSKLTVTVTITVTGVPRTFQTLSSKRVLCRRWIGLGLFHQTYQLAVSILQMVQCCNRLDNSQPDNSQQDTFVEMRFEFFLEVNDASQKVLFPSKNVKL